MATLVVDTDVVSYGFRGDTRFSYFAPKLVGQDAFVSFMTMAELDYWGLSRNWGAQRKRQLRTYVGQHFAMYPVTRRLCESWADVTDQAGRQGRVLSTADAWIAATAISLGVPLMTNNSKDFANLSGLRLITLSTN